MAEVGLGHRRGSYRDRWAGRGAPPDGNRFTGAFPVERSVSVGHLGESNQGAWQLLSAYRSPGPRWQPEEAARLHDHAPAPARSSR